MNAARRVRKPNAIKKPPLNSIQPATSPVGFVAEKDLVPAVAGEHQSDQNAYDAINGISITIKPIHRKPRQSG